MYVLERMSDARDRGAKIYGEIVGWAINSDASDFVMPNPERQAECMQSAMRRAGVTADEVRHRQHARHRHDFRRYAGMPGAATSFRRQQSHSVQQHQKLHRPRDGRRRRVGTGGKFAGV